MTRILSEQQCSDLLARYAGRFNTPELGYGTVRDYCDSCDILPFLASRQGDLKDLQRPWTLKAILGMCPTGARLLEIGAGEPIVAQMLTELGYDVTVVDPYDGSGHGPTEYEAYRQLYPDVTIFRGLFSADLPGFQIGSFDCIYSISVLEHVPEPALAALFAGVRAYLRPSGLSLHAIDHVVTGSGAEFHSKHLALIQRMQWSLKTRSVEQAWPQLSETIDALKSDIDTYYLSASGHNLWRGSRPYDEFPFRQVVSIQSCCRNRN